MRRWKKMQNFGVKMSMVQLAIKMTLLIIANQQHIYKGVAIGTLQMARVRLNKHYSSFKLTQINDYIWSELHR